jgi:hypothetical protein
MGADRALGAADVDGASNDDRGSAERAGRRGERRISPLDGIVETDWLEATFTMNWKLTRPNHTVALYPFADRRKGSAG